MTSLTRPRPGAKAKAPPAPETYHLTTTTALHLEIRRAGRFWTYAAEPLASDFGTAWQLRRLGAAEAYDVLLDDAHAGCSCPDATYRQRECKHARLVRAFLKGACTAA